jgi:hypothetical protein
MAVTKYNGRPVAASDFGVPWMPDAMRYFRPALVSRYLKAYVVAYVYTYKVHT